MRSLCLLVLMVGGFLGDDCVQARVIQAADDVNSFCHLYLLDPNTGSTHRLKRSHIEASEDHVHRVRLDLAEVNKVIDMDLKCGSVWDPDSNALFRNGEETQHILHDVPVTCFLSGHLRSGDGYASFSFCNGVSGIIHTAKEHYIIGGLDIDTSEDVALDDTDADLPSLTVTITNGDDLTPYPTDDTQEREEEALELEDGFDHDEDDVRPTEAPEDDDTEDSTTADTKSATTTTGTTPIEGLRKATVEVGIYINADQTSRLKMDGLTSVSQIMNWVINRWNVIRYAYKNPDTVGMIVDFKIRHLEIWFKNPDYYVPFENKTIGPHLKAFCRKSPDDGMDHRMIYTWETHQSIVGLAYLGTVCSLKSKCSIVIPQKAGVQRELHELGHNLGFQHETKIQHCVTPFGFMGWSNNPVFKDCYRPVFLKAMAKRSHECLYKLSEVKTQSSSFIEGKFIQANQTITDILDKW